MKLRPVRAELFLLGGQIDRKTDMRKLEVAFRSFANAHKNRSSVAATKMTLTLPVKYSLLYIERGTSV
jgi:hypothetical protein